MKICIEPEETEEKRKQANVKRLCYYASIVENKRMKKERKNIHKNR